MSNSQKHKKEEIDFKQVLNALVDPEKAFPGGYIHQLSSLEGPRLKQVREIWGRVPLERRRNLLEDMDDFSSSDFLLDFSPVARLALDDVDGTVRAFAVRILAADEEPQNHPVFLKLMNEDPDESVRAAAALAFSPLVYAGEMEEISANLQRSIEDSLLAKINGDDSDEVRRRALEALGFSSRPEMDELIKKAYQSGSQNWLISALFAMGRSANQAWNPQVRASLEDRRPLVRAEAASAAGELGLSEAVPALLGLLDDASPDVRSACIWSLSQIGGEGVRERLEKLVDETEDEEEQDLLEEALENLAFNEEFLPMMFDLEDMDDEDNEDDESPSTPDRGGSRRAH